jgi:cob(I)alamin adenosyltransferase
MTVAEPTANASERMRRVDTLLSHVWMVRTFLKHCDEAEEDEELQDIHRTLYDFMLALGGPLQADDAEAYLKQARKKLSKLRRAVELFEEIQPEVSGHTNFVMARHSLSAAVAEVARLLEED